MGIEIVHGIFACIYAVEYALYRMLAPCLTRPISMTDRCMKERCRGGYGIELASLARRI
jgi:hypothetical protein